MASDFIIVDVDDTIFEDHSNIPIPYVKEVLTRIRDQGTKVVYVTGRIFNPKQAIKDAGLPCDLVIYRDIFNPAISALIPTIIVKRYIIHRFKEAGLNPVMAFDDDFNIVNMYRNNGLDTVWIKEPGIWKQIYDKILVVPNLGTTIL